MTASAQGIDVSQFQAPITIAELTSLGLDFAYTKATEGLTITDPDLAANWATLAEWGKVRGVYHEFVATDNAVAQAQHCYAAVAAVGGFKPGDMVSVVASDYAGVTGAEIEAFCMEMRSLAGPHVVIPVYSDLSVIPSLLACTGWPLWVAWPNDDAPTAGQIAPWTAWTFWQWGTVDNIDRDAFNGTAADLAALIATYTSGAPAPAPAPAPSAAPAWPLGPDDYLGTPRADPHCYSGYFGDPGHEVVQQFQARMIARGWDLGPDGADGYYGLNQATLNEGTTPLVVAQFQAQKGLTIDHLAGKDTWDAAFEDPITPG